MRQSNMPAPLSLSEPALSPGFSTGRFTDSTHLVPSLRWKGSPCGSPSDSPPLSAKSDPVLLAASLRVRALPASSRTYSHAASNARSASSSADAADYTGRSAPVSPSRPTVRRTDVQVQPSPLSRRQSDTAEPDSRHVSRPHIVLHGGSIITRNAPSSRLAASLLARAARHATQGYAAKNTSISMPYAVGAAALSTPRH